MCHESLPTLGSPARLATLRRLGLLDTSAHPAFDRLTRLAARLLRAPTALVSFVEEDRQFFKSAIGLAEPWAVRRETPRSHSFCQYVIESGDPLIVADAREHPLLQNNPAIADMGVIAYAGMPLILHDGQRLGSFCVIDYQPRSWTKDEIEVLSDLAASALTEIELLADQIENARLFEQTKLAEERQRLLLEQIPCRLWTTDLDLRYTSLVGLTARELQPQPESLIGMSIYEFFGTDDPQLLPIAAHHRALAGQVSTYDMVGDGRVFQTHVKPFRDTQGQITGCIGVAIDITERRRVEQTLRDEFAFRTAIIKRAAEGLCVCHAIDEDPYVAFTVWNDRMADITGYTMDEINRRGWYQTMYPDPDLQARAQARMARMRDGDDMIAEEWEITRADGQKRVVTFSTSVLDSSDGMQHVLALLHDITERKRIEEALRESEERMRRLSEVAFEGIAIHDHGIIIDANQALADILRYDLDEIIGMPVLSFAAPEARDLLLAHIRAGPPDPYEVIGMRKDGTRITAEIQARPILYQGKSLRVAAIRDITARKQAEAALRESEERFRTLIRDLHVGVLLQGPQSEILLSNQAALDLLGVTEDQLLGKTSFSPDWNVIHEDGTVLLGPDHPVPQAIATRQPVRNVVMGVYRPITKDRAWLLVNAEPQLADDGSVRQVICSFSDITERKQAEAALRESEDRYRTFFQHSIDAILLTAPDGSIFAANPAACRIFGRSEAEICRIGRNGVIDTNDPRLAAALEQRARTGSYKGELTYIHRDGTRFPGELSTALFKDRNGQTKTSMIIRDITDRKRAEEALQASQKLLQGIIDHAPMTIVIQDVADGRYLLVNRSLEATTGRSVEQLLGKTLADLYPPECVAVWRAQDRQIARTQQAIQVEDDVRHSDGTLHTSLGIKFPLFDSKGDVYAIGGIFTDITERKRAEQEREQLIEALQEALANIKTLRGLLPICASCKKIRDDSGYWSQIEAYVQAHSDAVFSHGICPDCARALYSDFLEE